MEEQVKAQKKASIFYDLPPNNILRTLIGDNASDKAKFADSMGVSIEAVRLWTTGYARPDISKLSQIADYFTVSMDYLFGRTEHKTNDLSMQAACTLTGLTENAILKIQAYKETNKENWRLNTLNDIIENEEFYRLIALFYECVEIPNRLSEKPKGKSISKNYLAADITELEMVEFTLASVTKKIGEQLAEKRKKDYQNGLRDERIQYQAAGLYYRNGKMDKIEYDKRVKAIDEEILKSKRKKV